MIQWLRKCPSPTKYLGTPPCRPDEPFRRFPRPLSHGKGGLVALLGSIRYFPAKQSQTSTVLSGNPRTVHVHSRGSMKGL